MAYFNREKLIKAFERHNEKKVMSLYQKPITITVQFAPGGKRYQYLIDNNKTPTVHALLFHHLMTKAIEPTKSVSVDEDSLVEKYLQFKVNGSYVSICSIGGEVNPDLENVKTLGTNNYFVNGFNDDFMDIVLAIQNTYSSYYKTQKTKTEKDDFSMKTTNSIMSKIGNKVSDVFAMSMTGGFATKLGEDYYTVQDSQLTRVTDFIMGDFAMDGYTMPTAVSAVKVGDLVATENGNGIVLQITNGKEIKMITAGGTIVNYVPVKDFPMLPEAMVLTVMNPMGDQRATTNPTQPAINPMMFMMMGKDKGGDNDMFKMMAMSQMMGGQNPMSGMFGTPVTPVDTEKAKD